MKRLSSLFSASALACYWWKHPRPALVTGLVQCDANQNRTNDVARLLFLPLRSCNEAAPPHRSGELPDGISCASRGQRFPGGVCCLFHTSLGVLASWRLG